MRGHDYAGGGKYFVTICVNKRAKDFSPLLGTVVAGRMVLNDTGRIAAQCWHDIPRHFPQVVLDQWVIMPDHVHGIIILRDDEIPEGAKDFSPLPASPTASRPRGTSRTIGSIVRGFKIGVTKSLGGYSAWQRGYYDIIIRDEHALSNIRRYIRHNPANYDVYRYGEPRFVMGDRALLDLPITAFLASRDVRDGTHGMCVQKGERFFAPAAWPVWPQCVVSGFLSPMEQTVFNACLAGGIPMVHILARGLPERFPLHICRAIDAGKLLVMTPFESAVDRFSAARAAWCNQYALHLAKEVVIGQVSQDGMLACLLSDLSYDVPVLYLNTDQAGSI